MAPPWQGDVAIFAPDEPVFSRRPIWRDLPKSTPTAMTRAATQDPNSERTAFSSFQEAVCYSTAQVTGDGDVWAHPGGITWSPYRRTCLHRLVEHSDGGGTAAA